MIETVILDLDGPLLDGRLRHYTCYRQILESHSYKALDLEDYWQMKRERLDRRRQLAASQAEAIYDQFLQAWLDLIEQPHILKLDRLQPGALEKLRQWKDAGVQLILATARHNPEHLKVQLSDLGLAGFLDHVVVTPHDEGGTGKAQRVKKLLAGAPSCLWVGDTEMDIDAARALGCPIWAVTCGLRTEAFLKSLGPDYLSADIRQVDVEIGDVPATGVPATGVPATGVPAIDDAVTH